MKGKTSNNAVIQWVWASEEDGGYYTSCAGIINCHFTSSLLHYQQLLPLFYRYYFFFLALFKIDFIKDVKIQAAPVTSDTNNYSLFNNECIIAASSSSSSSSASSTGKSFLLFPFSFFFPVSPRFSSLPLSSLALFLPFFVSSSYCLMLDLGKQDEGSNAGRIVGSMASLFVALLLVSF